MAGLKLVHVIGRWRCDSNIESKIFKLILQIDVLSTSHVIDRM